MLPAGGFDVDSGGFDAAVAQDICQRGDVFLDFIEAAGEQVTHVVGIDFRGVHLRRVAQALHHAPDIAAIQRFSAAASEDRAARDFFLFHIFLQ